VAKVNEWAKNAKFDVIGAYGGDGNIVLFESDFASLIPGSYLEQNVVDFALKAMIPEETAKVFHPSFLKLMNECSSVEQ
jgi:hypothetical protein